MMQKLTRYFLFIAGSMLLFGVALAIDYKDGVPILKESAEITEVQENVIREGARKWCAEVEDDNEREQCVVDYFVNHNYQGEPDCD